jgi:multiple sugar transport system permease protein
MAAIARTQARASTRRHRGIGRGWLIATYVALAIFLVWTCVPIIWMVLASLKTNKEIYDEFTILPKQLYLGHYLTLIGGNARAGALASGNFGVWLKNSALVSAVTTSISITLGSLAAYALTRLQFAGRRLVARGLIVTYLVPASLLFIPLFQIVVSLGLGDTLLSLIVVYPTFTLPFCTWMLLSYFRSIPFELEEAALIDGCNRIGVLFRITMPLSLPAVATVALFSFTQSWNEFIYAVVFTNSLATRTVTVGLTQMFGEDVFFWGQMMAGAILAALPPVIIYTMAQRLVIQGLVGGGVKG